MRYCAYCGAAIPDDSLFCPSCGAKCAAPEQPKSARAEKPAGRGLNIRAFLLGLCISLALIAGLTLLFHGSLGGRNRLEGPGFKTPEKAVEAYAKAMKKGDLDGMLSTFALESFTENVNGKAWIDTWGLNLAENIYEYGFFPNESDLTLSLNAEGRRALIGRMIYAQYEKLLVDVYDYKNPNSSYVEIFDKDKLREFIRELGKPNPFSGAEIGEVREPKELRRFEVIKNEYVKYYSEDNICDVPIYNELVEKYAGLYGVEELQERFLVLEIDGKEYLLFFTVGKYGDRWYNITFNSCVMMCTPHGGGICGLYSMDDFN